MYLISETIEIAAPPEVVKEKVDHLFPCHTYHVN
jgi:hypothetical protein